MKADIPPTSDAGEPLSAMEPLWVADGARQRSELNDLALELAQRFAGYRRSLPPGLVVSLARLVRSTNCYYSNLIEGHDTHPVDIERALAGDLSADPRQRDLQLEARAHVTVQAWIDGGGLAGRVFEQAALCEIHRRFCEVLPAELMQVDDPRTGARLTLVRGEFRRQHVAVGRHVPVSPGAVPRFIDRLLTAYGRLGRAEAIVATAAAHHRLLWVHPFLDGNGRVARLWSHAILLETLDTGAIWSVARGLARHVADYKSHLAACDRPRRNDLDGRGSLSEESLAEFTRFFLTTCLDQVRFMEDLVQPDALRTRILAWADEEARLGRLPARGGAVLAALLYRGELPRAEVPAIVGAGERQARRIVAPLIEAGVVTSPTPRAPLSLAFPATLAARWLPGLFPERGDAPRRR
jgi:Fic family protein